MSSQNVTMPKWPAWILFGTMALSAYPAMTATAPRTEAAGVASATSIKPVVLAEAKKGSWRN
jgi:hypothetical protein